MGKESNDKFIFAFAIALVLSWLFASLMKSSGIDQSASFVWYLVSGIRWILTFAAAILAALTFIPKWLEGNQKRAELRQLAYENSINTEVERRLRAIREEEWREKEKIRKIEAAKQEEERKRKQLEAQWRKEYEEKLEEEFRTTRTATDATQNACDDFI